MCNAWNHPPGCPCGWGGGWQGPSGLTAVSAMWPARVTNFVNPFASCPVCGAAVFYFESREGGRVFFDSLGPPWPKHPCTDTSRFVSVLPAPSAVPIDPTAYGWHMEGWRPLIVNFVFDYTPTLLRVDGAIESRELELFVRKSHLPAVHSKRDYLARAAIQSRAASMGDYVLSILGSDMRPLNTIGYSSSLDAEEPRTAPGLALQAKGRRVRKKI